MYETLGGMTRGDDDRERRDRRDDHRERDRSRDREGGSASLLVRAHASDPRRLITLLLQPNKIATPDQ